jgi:hypothetical protein
MELDAAIAAATREADAAAHETGQARARLRAATGESAYARLVERESEAEYVRHTDAVPQSWTTGTVGLGSVPSARRMVSMRDQLDARVRRVDQVEELARRGALFRESKDSADSEWRWLNTTSFWIGCFFAIGSLLFVIGTGASWYARRHEGALGGWKREVLVDYTQLWGGCYFVVGSYLGWFEVINVAQPTRRLCAGPADGVSGTGYWGALLYFVGALVFQVAVVATVVAPDLSPAGELCWVWAPQAPHSVSRTVVLEWCVLSRHWRRRWRAACASRPPRSSSCGTTTPQPATSACGGSAGCTCSAPPASSPPRRWARSTRRPSPRPSAPRGCRRGAWTSRTLHDRASARSFAKHGMSLHGMSLQVPARLDLPARGRVGLAAGTASA